jgi:hypothetical protein
MKVAHLVFRKLLFCTFLMNAHAVACDLETLKHLMIPSYNSYASRVIAVNKKMDLVKKDRVAVMSALKVINVLEPCEKVLTPNSELSNVLVYLRTDVGTVAELENSLILKSDISAPTAKYLPLLTQTTGGVKPGGLLIESQKIVACKNDPTKPGCTGGTTLDPKLPITTGPSIIKAPQK